MGTSLGVDKAEHTSSHNKNMTYPQSDISRHTTRQRLEALAVHDGGARLVVLLLGDPHLLEGRQRGQDGATDPYRVLALGRSNDLDLDGAGSQSSDLLLHAVSNTRVHGGASGQHGVGVQVLTDVDVALHDGV